MPIWSSAEQKTFSSTTPSTRIPTNTVILKPCELISSGLGYDQDSDTFRCPADKSLHFQYASCYTIDNGYVTDQRIYECFDCADCPLRSQ